jgi:anti-sigma factor RsiW
MPCPTFESVIDFADGALGGTDNSNVEKHIADCPDCRAALAWYEQTVATAAADTSVEPPAWVTKKAIGLFVDAREAAERRGIRGLVARLRAALVFDSLAGSDELVYARSGAPVASRQLLYNAAPYDVDLLIASATGNRVAVTGQVLAADAGADGFEGVGGLTVELARAGDVVATATTSEFGEFTLDEVAPGRYDIWLVGDGREIVLSDAPVSID